jgi:hypothetical protein
LIAGWLAMEISNRKLDAQVRDPDVSKAADSPKKDTAADLQSRVEQLEKELQNLKRNDFLFGLPRSRDDASKPDAIEINIMRTLVESRLQTWQRVKALQEVGQVGGEMYSETQARFQLYMAFARLAWTEHKAKETLEYLEQATIAGRRQVDAVEASFTAGQLGIDTLIKAQQDLAEVDLSYYWAGGKIPDVKLEDPWTLHGKMPKPYGEKAEEPQKQPLDNFPGLTPPPPSPDRPGE